MSLTKRLKIYLLLLCSFSVYHYITKRRVLLRTEEPSSMEQYRQVTKRTLKYRSHAANKTHMKLVYYKKTALQNEGAQLRFFADHWRQQHDYRANFRRILGPCKNSTEWMPRGHDVKMITSAKYSRVALDIQSAGQYSRIIIYSMSLLNKRKNIGGDTWRVFVFGTTSVPVSLVDNMDGTYTGSFLIVEPGSYHIDLHLDYTLCDGYKDPPPQWFVKGNKQGKYQPGSALPGKQKSFLDEKHPANLSFSVKKENFFAYEEMKTNLTWIYTTKPCYMWDGFGRWINTTKWRLYNTAPFKEKTDIKRTNGKGVLWIFGDSTGDFFYRVNINKPLCKRIFNHCNRTYNWVYNTHGDLMRAKSEKDDTDFDVLRILSELKDVLVNPTLDHNSALLINYGLHFTQTIPFKTFERMIERVIRLLRDWQREKGFKIVWKTTTAFQKWKWGDPKYGGSHSKANRFFTSQRVSLFNAFTTQRMCDSGFDVMDVYPMTLSYPKGTGSPAKPWDAVHYEPIVFKSVEDYLYKYFSM